MKPADPNSKKPTKWVGGAGHFNKRGKVAQRKGQEMNSEAMYQRSARKASDDGHRPGGGDWWDAIRRYNAAERFIYALRILWTV
jgi:hypothetical protein